MYISKQTPKFAKFEKIKLFDNAEKFFAERCNEGYYKLFFTPHRGFHELLPQSLIRILFIELFFGEREPVFGDVVEHCSIGGVNALNGLVITCITGIRMMTLHQFTMTGLDFSQAASLTKAQYSESVLQFGIGHGLMPTI